MMEMNTLSQRLSVPFNPDTPTRSRLDYWVTLELCVPGRMQLVPVCAASGEIVDLTCVAASPAIGRLFNEASGEPVGQRLSALLARHEGGSDVLTEYIKVATHGDACCCETLSELGERVQHRVNRSRADLVEALLRDKSAVERARSAFASFKL